MLFAVSRFATNFMLDKSWALVDALVGADVTIADEPLRDTAVWGTIAKILLVEDDPLIATYIADVLGESGFQIAGIASTGEEALSIAEVSPIDIALVDIKLAGLIDGVEVARRIHECYGTRSIFLSGALEQPTLERASVANPLGFLQRPFRPSQVFTALDKALRQLGAPKQQSSLPTSYAHSDRHLSLIDARLNFPTPSLSTRQQEETVMIQRHSSPVAATALTVILPLLLGACATNEAVKQAQDTATTAKSTADQAMSTAQQALQTAQAAQQTAQAASQQAAQAEADAKSADEKADRMFQKSLRK